MKRYILVRIKTLKKTDCLLKLNRLDVDIKEIQYEEEYLKFKILDKDLKKIKKYLISYKVEILDETGIYKLKKELKKNNLIIIGIIFASIVFLILSNVIVKINVIHENSQLRELILNSLEEKGVTTFSFKKSYEEYESILNSIKEEYRNQIEWIEIEVEGMIINVRVEERIINNYEKDYSTCHIVASKSGIIRSIKTTKGVTEVSINDYVTKGEVLINGSIKLNDEIKENVCAAGEVYAEVWYKVSANIPLTEEIYEDTGKMRYNLMIKNNSKETVLLKSRINKEKRVENILLFRLFGIEVYLQKEYEIESKIYNYKEEAAISKLKELIEEKLKLKLNKFESIIDEKVLQKELKNNNIYIDMFIAVKEQIGIKEYFDTRSDTNDEEHNEHTNRVY